MNDLIAENVGNPLRGFGPLGLEGRMAESGGGIFSQFITTIIGLLTVIAIIWFIFLLVTGAIGVMTAGGDKNALESARKRLTNAIIGLVVLIAALFILVLIAYLIGLDMNTILSPERFLEQVWGS